MFYESIRSRVNILVLWFIYSIYFIGRLTVVFWSQTGLGNRLIGTLKKYKNNIIVLILFKKRLLNYNLKIFTSA